MLEEHHGRIDAAKFEDGKLRIIGEDSPHVQVFDMDALGRELLRHAFDC